MKKINQTSTRLPVAAVACLAGIAATPALATNGYFANGYDTISKGMAGAGVAIEDGGVMGLAINPALGTQVGNEAAFCLSYFNPERSFKIDGVLDKQWSENTSFFVPCAGANFIIDERSTLGIIAYGNGGMNTEYEDNPFGGMVGGTSPYGVNLEQLFIGLNYSYQVNDQLSLGVAPIYAIQRFSATGLEFFTNISSDPENVTNNDDSWSTGWGFSLGLHFKANEQWAFGAAYRSRINMSEFDDYAGLFAEQGDFDIPPTFILGAAFTPAADPRWTITAEYQRIWYSQVDAIANSGALLTPPDPLLGDDDGYGFGWNDMDIFRLAASYEANDQWTLRGGVSYSTEFTDENEVMFNTLAPATPQWHASIGATYQIDDRWSVSGSYTHAFNNELEGANETPGFTNPVTLQMYQNELSIGANFKW